MALSLSDGKVDDTTDRNRRAETERELGRAGAALRLKHAGKGPSASDVELKLGKRVGL